MHFKKTRAAARTRIISFALCVSMILCLLAASGAWLYDEDTVGTDYSVAQLDFDLTSNHMYYYYTDNPDYIGNAEKYGITDLVSLLSTYCSSLSAGSMTLESFDSDVITELKKIYDDNMINALRDELFILTDQTAFDNKAEEIYTTYTAVTGFPFKIRGFDVSLITTGTSFWYYVAKDILDLYSAEDVIQKNADGVSSSTVNLGVKLRGGTTFSSDINGDYYDVNFNEMVKPVTMKLKNTGNTSMFLNFGMVLDASLTTGLNCMVLPYGTALPVGDTPDYRSFICDKLDSPPSSDAFASFRNDSDFSAYSSADWQTLSYSQLSAALSVYNNCALETYVGTSATGNIELASDSSIAVNMLFYADYETCCANTQGGEAVWSTDDAYKIYEYTYTVNVLTSLKDVELTSNGTDWTKKYNRMENYEKFAAVSNFSVDGFAYFLQEDGTELNAMRYIRGGYIECNYIDSTAANYFTRFRFAVKYRGFSPAYIRVRVVEEFTNSHGEIEAVNQISFKPANNWFDNRLNDLYFYSREQYYSTDRDTLTSAGLAKLLRIPVIDGVYAYGTTNDALTAADIDPLLATETDMSMKLSIMVEAVQPNRFEEFWNMNTIPG